MELPQRSSTATDQDTTPAMVARQNRMLHAISRAQSLAIESSDAAAVFGGLLAELLALTEAEYGFIGEVLYSDEGQPYLKTHAITNIAWDEPTRALYAQHAPSGMVFSNLKSLFGAALVTGKPVIANQPATDPRRGGLPSGHPPLKAFLGIPIEHGQTLLAMVGLANQPGGFRAEDVAFLDPLCKTIGQLVHARRGDQQRQRALDELERTATLLAQRTQALKTTLDSMSQGIAMAERDGPVTVYNQRFLELLELPESLLALQPSYEEVLRFQTERGDFGDNYAAVDDAARGHLASARIEGAPERYLRRNRKGRVLEVVTRELAGGGIVRTYADVTEQQEVHQKLRDSELRFRSLTQLSSDWYWLQDENFRFIKFEGEREQKTRRLEAVDLGQTRWEIGAENMSQDDWEVHRRALEAHQAFRELELERRTPDGSTYWISISGEPIFDEDEVFRGYRGIGCDITSRKLAEAQIERLAFYDALTGLPNRRLLYDRLQQAVVAGARREGHGGLLFIDLDNFKAINDTQGHDVGDELLKQVAERLSQCVRQTDTVARLGGDEFVVMLDDLSEHESEAAAQLEAIGRKILLALNQPIEVARQKHHSSPSIGVTLFRDHSETADELLKRADLAMYQAKAAGRNTMRFFDPQMQAVVTDRARLEADLRHGLAHGELLLHYQPVVDAVGQTTGVEALARWQHPSRGLVSPALFIPLAEQTGLILPLGQWVLEVACTQLVAWSARAATRGWTMAVNVSARQFRHADFVRQVLNTLRTTGANPYRLKLELTESLLVSDVDDAIAKMSELRSIGVRFSLDDFGTGYSSLSYLQRLPLDQLKIDQSFVRDVLKSANDAAIVRTILSLAQSMELAVVAEGVETRGQHEFLAQCGCKAFQGYLFGRPAPLAA